MHEQQPYFLLAVQQRPLKQRNHRRKRAGHLPVVLIEHFRLHRDFEWSPVDEDRASFTTNRQWLCIQRHVRHYSTVLCRRHIVGDLNVYHFRRSECSLLDGGTRNASSNQHHKSQCPVLLAFRCLLRFSGCANLASSGENRQRHLVSTSAN